MPMTGLLSLLLLAAACVVSASGKGLVYSRQTTGVTGDKKCGFSMCVAATVNGSQVNYVLSSTGKQSPLGWMGMGFGRQMAGTPMVIMWPNSDGTITISQRQAPSEVMPTVDSNPPRVATLSQALSMTSGSTPQLAYSIPANSDTTQPIIYAFGTTPPGSSEKDATLQEHVDYGALSLDLTKTISTTSGSSPTSTTGSSPDDSSDELPLLPYQRVIVAHAIFCVVGFLLLLPAGALLARYLRIVTPTWFKGHWIAQFAIAGPVIITGVALGIRAVNQAGALHVDDNHKKWGIVIFAVYFVQCALGAFIHFVKPRGQTRRPPQNYIHAVLGLFIIAIALYQVHNGYDQEWPRTTGRGALPKGVKIIFYVWAVLLPVAYFAGLSLLPKQFRQESQAKVVNTHGYDGDADHLNMNTIPSGRYKDLDR